MILCVFVLLMQMNFRKFDGQENLKAVDYEMCSIWYSILPDKFDGKKFRIWQWEMELYLSHLKLDKNLNDVISLKLP